MKIRRIFALGGKEPRSEKGEKGAHLGLRKETEMTQGVENGK